MAYTETHCLCILCGSRAQRVQQCVCVGGMEVGQSFKASKGE